MMDALIFDLDGTLWDSTYAVADIWNTVLEEHEDTPFRLTQPEISRLFGRTMEEIAAVIFRDLSPEKRAAYMHECEVRECEVLARTGALLYPHVEETLALLSRSYDLYIVSNCQDGYVQAFLQAHHLAAYFRDYEMYGRTMLLKADNIRLLMERNHISKAAYIGDTAGDETSSREAGIPFIHAAYGFGTSSAPAAVIRAFSELPGAAASVLK